MLEISAAGVLKIALILLKAMLEMSAAKMLEVARSKQAIEKLTEKC